MRSNRHNHDEDEKLQAYDSKDYSELIEFPVELVDRDGVVRRYSYEESLAVYHRRIQSAPWRYSETELVQAEIGHCTRRIDQIRRSYRNRADQGESVAAPNPRAALGEGYDAVREHYRGLLSQRGLTAPDDLPLVVRLLQDESGSRVYHVGLGGDRAGHLLYVYPFDRLGDGNPREAWERARDSWRGIPPGGADVERLLMSAEAGGSGYLLTGLQDLPAGLQALANAEDANPALATLPDPGDSQPFWMATPGADAGGGFDPFQRGLDALSNDRTEEAIASFRHTVERNPYHREAYLALLAVLDGAGRHEEAEMYGAMAESHLPGDALVKYRQGLNLLRRGDLDEAVAAFDESAARNPGLSQPAYFAAHVLLARGKDLDGAHARLTAAAAVADDDEDHVGVALRRVEGLVRVRTGLRVGGAVCAGLFALAALMGQPVGWVGVAPALALAATANRTASIIGRWVLRRTADPESDAE